jgi:YD repeat-containing protein
LIRIADSYGNFQSVLYDANGWLTGITDPLNRVFDFTFDAVGNRITGRDPLSRTTHLEYDALNWLVAAPMC